MENYTFYVEQALVSFATAQGMKPNTTYNCPVPKGQLVEIVLGTGDIGTAKAGTLLWGQRGGDTIMFWREVQE